MSKKVILGFSGGLDTTYCVKYLSEEKGYEVHSIIVNTGGFTEEELTNIEKHAHALGVASHTTVNAVKTYYDRIIRFLVYGNVLKNNTYPLSVSAGAGAIRGKTREAVRAARLDGLHGTQLA